MTSNEKWPKTRREFYGLIEGDVSVSGGELAKLFVTALDQAGLALSEKAKAYISFEPVLPNGKTLADMFASSGYIAYPFPGLLSLTAFFCPLSMPGERLSHLPG